MKQSDLQSHTLLIEDAGRLSLLAHDVRATYSELQSALITFGDNHETSPEVEQEISRLSHTSAHLGRLLDEVSRALFQNHQDRLYSSVVSTPRRTLAGLVERWRSITEQLGSQLLLTGEEQMPETATCDMLAFERVLSNLVSNALHHAGPGPISIDISRSGQGAHEDLLVRIRDSGPGFPQHILNRPDDSPLPIGSGEPGSGFGIRIACQAMQHLKGRLTLQNPPDGGAEASISIPLSELALPADHKSPLAPSLTDGLTALLVEDSTALRLQMRHHLEGLGCSVIEAKDGIDALNMLMDKSAQIDVVFLDIELPLLSGKQVLSILRSRHLELPPVIAITAHVFENNLQAIQAGGADVVLRKPISTRAEILNGITQAMQQQGVGENTHDLTTIPAPKDPPSLSPPNQDPTAQCLRNMVRHLPLPLRKKVLKQVSSDLEKYLDIAWSAAHAAPSPEAEANLSRATHTLSSLFAAACHNEARGLSQAMFNTADRRDTSEIIAFLTQLRQISEHIQKTIHSIIDSETNDYVSIPHLDC